MRIRISREQAAAIEAALPEGRKAEDIRFVRCMARLEAPTAEDLKVASDLATSSGPPMTKDGLPNVMRVVSWFYHEGVNRNRFGFDAEDMGPSADAIRAPNLVPMDWNHSSVFQWREDPRALGVWYYAEKRWDPTARGGKGAYGVQGFGTMWAWAFPEKANELLAMQERNGFVEFSVAVVPKSVTWTSDENGPFELLHEPIIIAHSALDVRPADEDAVGLLVEGSTDPDVEERLRAELDALATNAATDREAQHTEENMDELMQELAALKAAKEAGEAEAARAAEVATAAVEAAVSEKAVLEGRLAESEVAREALVAEAAAMKGTIDTLTAELEGAKQALAELRTREAEAQADARLAERMEKLPAAYRTALEKRSAEDQARFKAKWRAASEAEWTEFESEVLFAFADIRPNYLRLSQEEGGALPTGGGDPASLRSLLRRAQ